MTPRTIVPRSVIGVPDPGTRPVLAGSLKYLLTHYAGVAGFNDPTKDLVYAKSVAAYGISAGKSFEYSYLVGLGGTIFEQAGDRRASHCLNWNNDSYGILMMLGIGVQPTSAMIDSFRWLRNKLTVEGNLHLQHQAVPHYRFRSTSCPGLTIADKAGARWTSPTGEGSLGNLHAPWLMPWVSEPIPIPQPIPQPTPVEDEDMTLYRKQGKSAVWLADGRSRKHVTTQAQSDALRAIYGPILLLDEAQSLGDLGIVVGADPGDV